MVTQDREQEPPRDHAALGIFKPVMGSSTLEIVLEFFRSAGHELSIFKEQRTVQVDRAVDYRRGLGVP
jgi:hypothetical protein